MQKTARLVYEDEDVIHDFHQAFGNNIARINSLKINNVIATQISSDDSVIVIAGENDWDGAIRLLEKMKKDQTPIHAIVSSPLALQKTMTQIAPIEERFSENGISPSKTVDEQCCHDFNFSELIEKKLGEFVRKICNSEGSDLHDLLIQEVEKPLIKLVLKETGGNQVQAAQLLGMHRNTLRKKVKDLEIPVLKKNKR